MVGYRLQCSPRLRAVSIAVMATLMGNIGSGVFRSFCFLLRVRDSAVISGGGGGISPGGAVGGGGAFESEFFTLGVVENDLIEAVSVLPFELPPALQSGRGWILW